jgi:hypothetical protein
VFELLLWVMMAVSVAAMIYAYDGSRDVFHPLMFIAPMFAFLYGWMPLRLYRSGELAGFFESDQLLFVQCLNLAGVICFIGGCLAAGRQVRRSKTPAPPLPARPATRLIVGGAALGVVGLGAWILSIVNVGGLQDAFARPYGGGWDNSGYVRDGSLLLLAAILMLLAAIARSRAGLSHIALLALFTIPWLMQSLLTSRRGPTFVIFMVLAMGRFINRNRRPSIIAAAFAGLGAGYLILLLVVNRAQIYLGSDFHLTTDVSSIVEAPNTGNEYIYGAGAALAAQAQGKHFWGRRYLAQILVRPIPTAIWPSKYEDFGVPELLNNAGTAEGFGDALGWVGAVGAAPGIVADLWIELWWLALPAMSLLGWIYGRVWRKAVQRGGAWATQYVVLSAFSIYMVMQTMEAVIFRCLLLSAPTWLVWKWALRSAAGWSAAPLSCPRLSLSSVRKQAAGRAAAR